ncbi:MAG: hypothetical protein DRJ99_02215 [Thermoplasmata archaeon]|nr:MAG: hypothetical protein FE038_01490 [Thermoplasmata archaeon]MCD6108015.1 hypothetical protein [Thermoplasmata archaeon]RLF30545.1 MAG: hypothetical protein DRJ99_02215 [Thermoplasmata archaeon]
MEETLEELVKQREELQKKANEARNKRDQLHLQSKKLILERDSLNAKIRELREQAKEHRKRRDEINERVKNAKKVRNQLNEAYEKIRMKIRALEKKRSVALGGPSIRKLKNEVRQLEHEQMTRPMSPQNEKELIEKIAQLHLKIKEKEKALLQDPKIKKTLEEEKQIKEKAEKQHRQVEELAKKAQQEHEKMINLLKQCDQIREKINELQEKIVIVKIEADKIHNEFISYVDKIHELDRKIAEEKKKSSIKLEDLPLSQKRANEIFERFKRGEKLSTEDLMILQKAGLI